MSLVETVETLRVELNLEADRPLVETVDKACEQLGLTSELKGQTIVAKADACLQTLGKPAVTMGAVVTAEVIGPAGASWPPRGPELTEAHLAAGGWKLVRRVACGSAWHPARDQLRGTESYGRPGNGTWSLRFDGEKFDEFLFTTGDRQHWLWCTRAAAAVGGNYENAHRQVLGSSLLRSTHYRKWYHRKGALEDPWVSLKHHWDDDRTTQSARTPGVDPASSALIYVDVLCVDLFSQPSATCRLPLPVDPKGELTASDRASHHWRLPQSTARIISTGVGT